MFKSFTLIFLLFLIIPIIGLSYYQINKSLDEEYRYDARILADHVEKMTIRTHKNLQIYENSFTSLVPLDFLQDIVKVRLNNDTIENIYQNLSLEEKTNGSIYPALLNSSEEYQSCFSQMIKIQNLNENIEMIRIFYKDGNVLVGVVNGSQDLIDFKGDKSWFSDSLELENDQEIYISPISIARRTNTSSLRFSSGIYIDGEIQGIFVINYKVDPILCPIANFQYSSTSINLLVDLNYENAEGVQLGEVYLARSDQPNYFINESQAGNIEFNSSMFQADEDQFPMEIQFNNQDYYMIYGNVTIRNRSWIIITIETQESFSESVTQIKRELTFFFHLFILIITIITLTFTYYTSHKLSRLEKEKQELTQLFPICANCKKIRDDKGYWNHVEEYLHEHQKIDFSHTLCPSCVKTLYPELDTDEKEEM